ncbi:MAG: PAS domain S-box protein [Anaerolineae bacterium]|nr:PAS domain S-box protein [Anaerolineae bacterium]
MTEVTKGILETLLSELKLGNYEAVLSQALDVLAQVQSRDTLDNQADLLQIIAESYRHLDAWEESLASYLKLLNLYERRYNEPGQALTHNAIGIMHLNLGQYEQALEHFRQGEQLARSTRNPKLQAETWENRSKVHAARDDRENALLDGLESVRLYQSVQAQQEQARVLFALGKIYLARPSIPDATDYFNRALTLFKESAYPPGETVALAGIAEIYQQQNDLENARAAYEQAIESAGDDASVAVCHQALAALYKQRGDLEKALHHLEQFQIHETILRNAENRRKIGNLEILQRVRVHRHQSDLARKDAELADAVAQRQEAETEYHNSRTQIEALFQLVHTLASHDKLPALLQSVAMTVAQKLPASQVVLHIFDMEHQQVAYFVEGRSNVPHPFQPPFDNLMDTLIGWAVLKEQPILTTQDRFDPRESKDAYEQRVAAGIHSIIIKPLEYGEVTFGALTAMNTRSERSFDYNDLLLLKAMSALISIAISNIQRIEETVRLKEFNESIVEGVGEAILIEDRKGQLVFANPAAETLMGYSRDALTGKHWTDIVPEEEVARIHTIIADRPVDRHLHYETILRHNDGHVIPVIASTTNLREQGRISGVLAAFTDITELKQAEETLRQRTAKLEIQNIELDAFAHTVAHDLRTPLTTVVGFSDLLRFSIDAIPEDRRQYALEAIRESGFKMSEIINELLLLANVRQVSNVETELLDMASPVAAVQARLSYQIEKLQASLHLPEQWPQAIGHGPWIEGVWANYVGNALKYGGRPDEGVLPDIELGYSVLGKPADGDALAEVLLRQEKIRNPQSKIAFWVRDNGQGLSPEEQARLFIPFERLNQAHAEGHGLGLSIVRRIIEKMGGEVGVESQIGEGSTFYFTLPAAAESNGQ